MISLSHFIQVQKFGDGKELVKMLANMFVDKTLTRLIAELFPEIILVIVEKVFEECQELDRAFGFGARDYLLKCIALSKVVGKRWDLQK